MIATCLHCDGDCWLTNGAEIYLHLAHLSDGQIWKCDPCQAWVGCQDGGTKPLGQPSIWTRILSLWPDRSSERHLTVGW